MINQQQTDIIISTIMPYKPIMIGLFGSYSRNEETSKSDIDLLVDFSSQINLFDIIGIEQKLTDELKIKIDLVSKNALHTSIKPYVENDLKIIYHA
ncbi:MAG: hypothetical protein RJA07_2430 [Bacteroidota bacterium]